MILRNNVNNLKAFRNTWKWPLCQMSQASSYGLVISSPLEVDVSEELDEYSLKELHLFLDDGVY